MFNKNGKKFKAKSKFVLMEGETLQSTKLI